MPRKKGSQNKMTVDIKRAVEYAFNKVNHDNQWLIKMASSDDPAEKKLFVALVTKCIPSAVAVSVSHTIDLSEAMIEADKNIKRLEAEYKDRELALGCKTETPIIDASPISLDNKDLE